MTTLAEDIDRRMYATQVAAVSVLDDLEKSGGLTDELKIKLHQIVDVAQDIVNIFRGPNGDFSKKFGMKESPNHY